METKKFKIGDKVRVKSLKWYNEKKDSIGHIPIGQVFTDAMSKYCGSILTIKEIFEDIYIVNENTKNWQDWMLEDEAVTEEKQEFEQLKQKNMETKEMTQEEVFEFFKDTKILCTSKEESFKVQVSLFALGIEWISRKKGIDEDKYLLFINNKLEIQHTSDIKFWMDDVNKRIEPSEILAIKLKEEEKPKFDPKTLQPFDKVLVRDEHYDKWSADFFDGIDNEIYPFRGIKNVHKQLIPYNEETKHLHRTTEEAPDYYKNW